MSSSHGDPPVRSPVWDDPRIVAPDEATWMRMTIAQREASLSAILAVLDEQLETMGEGVPHYRAKSGAAADLDGHFRRVGRAVFLACELPVFYPAEAVIVPDVLAVLECDPDLELDSWVVADQRRGVDLVLEVRNTGATHKDLVENVRDYARLRIPEYFSFDCRSASLRGWRLGAAGTPVYQPIVPQGGFLASRVLGLELGVVERRLRFFASQAMIPTALELVARLQAMTDESQRAAADALDQASRARATLVASIVRLCERRGLPLDDAQRARVHAEPDAARLARWLDRCLDITSTGDLFNDG